MTRLEKTIVLANRRYAGLIGDSVRKALLEADEDVQLILSEEQATSYSPQEVVVKKHPASNGTKKRKITITENWGVVRKASKPKSIRKALIQRLKTYIERENLTPYKVMDQARTVDIALRVEDVRHWVKGDNLPSDINYEKLQKFLEVADIKQQA
jgi:hypothetical protein